jgi:hypothetical protein
MVKWHDVTENVKFALKDDGFDLVAPFRLDRYNALFAATDENSNSKITDAPEDCLCVVIGNTKRIWPIFEEYYKANIGTESMPKEEANPFDFYVKKKIDSICIADFVVAKYQTDSSLAIQKNGQVERNGDFTRRHAHVREQKIRSLDEFESGGHFSQRKRTGYAVADARGAEFNERDGTRERKGVRGSGGVL